MTTMGRRVILQRDWDGWVQATNSCEAEGAQVVLCVVDQDGFSGEVGWEAKSSVSAAAAGGQGERDGERD